MPTLMSTVDRAVLFAFFSYAAIVGFREALRVLRGGTLREGSGNYLRTLSFVNVINVVRRRPLQERLTRRQLRVYGLLGGLVGLLCTASAILVLCGVLHW